MHTHTHTNRHTYSLTGKPSDRDTHIIYTDGHTYRKPATHPDRQAHTHTYIQRI